jgi:hypothetical protein
MKDGWTDKRSDLNGRPASIYVNKRKHDSNIKKCTVLHSRIFSTEDP